MNDDIPALRQSVRRTVGIAALRRLRRLVEAEDARQQNNSRWAQRFGLLFLGIGILLLAWLITRIV